MLLDKAKKYFLDLPQNDEVGKVSGKPELTVNWRWSKTSPT